MVKHRRYETSERKRAESDSGGVKSRVKKRKRNDGAQLEDHATKATAIKTSPSSATWSKSKKKRMRMVLAKQRKRESGESAEEDGISKGDEVATPVATEGASQKSKLQDTFKARLTGSRFRILNEELYTTNSEESFQRFSANPELFKQYHEGFRHQVESWPVNPVDVLVNWLSSKYRQSSCVVADFGCGDAQLAKDLLKLQQKSICSFTVHSFDLVSPNDLVTACDMANVPLKNKSVDVCVFCLSLMGTNLADFIREAHRVLKDNGKVKIAEVRSRIEYSHSRSSSKGDENDTSKQAGTLAEFIDVLQQLGFKCTKKDLSNKMFLVLELEKTGKAPDKKLAFTAKPCIYKRR